MIPQLMRLANVGGAVVGALLGGVLGHQVGGGRGKDVVTAGGAIAGGLASSAFDGTVRPFAAWMLVFMSISTFFVWWGTAKGTGQH